MAAPAFVVAAVDEHDAGPVDTWMADTFEAYYSATVGHRSGYAEFAAEAVLDDGAHTRIGVVIASTYWGGVLIHRVAVARAARGRGFGEALLRAALAWGRGQHGAALAVLDTMDYQAPRWYPRFGFTLDRVRRFPGDRSMSFFSRALMDADVANDGSLGPVPERAGPPVAGAPQSRVIVRALPPPAHAGANAFARTVFDEHALATTGGTSGYTSFAFAARDSAGALVGALDGKVFHGVVYVTGLIVDGAWRGRGVGSALTAAALDYGRSRGATAAQVETFDFQSPQFYRRDGWTEDFTRPGWRDGAVMHYFARDI